jgi:hypothetical protein
MPLPGRWPRLQGQQRCAQVGIADVNGVVAAVTKGCGRAGQVCIDEKTHPGHSLVGKA